MPRWSPWQAVSQMPDVQVALELLPNETGGGLLYRGPRTKVILLDRRLNQAERRATLAHELVHLERGSTSKCRFIRGGLSVEVSREEMRVQRIVAERLVPADELGPFVDRLVDLGHGVTAADVADEFGVPQVIASQALGELATVRARRMAS